MGATIESNLPAWGSAVLGYCDKLGYSVGTVLRWQVSRLCMDLVKLSPIAAAANIRSDVRTKFSSVNTDTGSGFSGTKEGKGVVRWYAASSTALFGVEKEYDLTEASRDDIYRAYFQGGRRLGLKTGKRGKQKVLISRRVTVLKSQLKELSDRLVNHIGRFKAGWTVSLEDCHMPHPPLPVKVLKWAGRANNARGRSEDNTNAKLNPSFTVVNFAQGARNARKGTFVQIALMRRTRYMRNHIKRLLANPDEAARTVPDEVVLSEGEE